MNIDNKNINSEDINDNINGQPLTYKTGEVAEMLNESPAMIRYYCKEFDDYLELDHNPGEHRTFTYKEINKLQYIIYLLKDNRYSVKQAKEFLSSPQSTIMSPVENNEEKIEALVSLISQELQKQIGPIIKQEIENTMQSLDLPIDKLHTSIEEQKRISDMVDNKITELIEQTNKENQVIKKKLNEIETSTNDIKNINSSLSKVDQFIVEYRQNLKDKQSNKTKTKKGFFSSLFNFGKNK